MSFDRQRYEREVLEPARARGNEPPADLRARYALTSAVLSGPGLAAHVTEVAAHWDTLRRSRKYGRLAEALLIAHAGLQGAGGLSRAAIEQQRRHLEQRLTRLVEDVAAAASCISPAARQRLVDGSGLDASTVRAALASRSVRVVEPPELVSEPPAKHRDLQRSLRALGLRLSPEVVFGERVRRGFRLLGGFALESGERLDADRIAAARRRLDSARLDDRKTAAANALTILDGLAGTPGAIRELVVWEITEAMRRTPVAPVTQRALAREAIDLGLRADEAAVLAVAVAEAGPGAPPPAVELEARAALEEGRLREAQRLAPALTGEEASRLREAIEATARKVGELRAEADRASNEGRDEEAAAALAAALRMAVDDEALRQRLHAIPPPAPVDPRLSVDGSRVTVGWRPSPARTGRLRYRVVRAVARPAATAGAGGEVATTEGVEAEDADAPAGRPLFYSVFASREDGVWSAPASTGPALVAPDVSGLRLSADGRSVSGAWQSHPGAAEVVVVRSEHGPPRTRTDGRLVRQATLLGFTDLDVSAGTTYHYRVVVVYHGPDGARHFSPGLVASIAPELTPPAVTDLMVAALAGRRPPVLQAAWTRPPRGAVRLWRSERQPAWPPGTVVPLTELPALGREVPGVPGPLPDGREGVELDAAGLSGRSYLTAVTCGRTRAAIGASVPVTLAEPVSGLTAQRFGDLVRLRWAWPPGSHVVLITWSPPGGGRAGAVECSLRQYQDEGCEIALGPGAATIAVRAVTREPAGDIEAPPVEVAVPALARAVRYEIRGGRVRRRRRTLVVAADAPCDLPPLVLVRRSGTLLPLRPDQGSVVTRVPAQRLEPDRPLAIEVELPPGPSRLRLFAEEPGAVLLVDPPASDLEVR